MIAFRNNHPSLGRRRFWSEDIHWSGVGPGVDLSHDSHSLAFFLSGASQQDDDLYVMINAYWGALSFTVQEGEVQDWPRVIDIRLPSPEDVCHTAQEQAVQSLHYQVKARSVVVLLRQASAASEGV